MNNQQVHVQWLYHSSHTIMDEVSHPQELFLSHECGNESLQKIVGKAKLSYLVGPDDVKLDEFFCKFVFFFYLVMARAV